jgi:tRNA pseudouridine55 synthase
MQEIILIDKPRGISSYDVIRCLKPHFPKGTKIGHAGTLDPQATGLMIVGVGAGTKKLNKYLKLPKVYEAEVLFGVQTDSGDLDGKIVAEQEVPSINEAKLETELHKLTGKIKLAVPMYSAVKIGGQPLYKYARRGDTSVEAPIKEMEIKWIKLHGLNCASDRCVAKIELEVASGTYIRSIAEELGRRLNLPATLQNLRRTKIGDFKIENAISLPH